MQSKDKLVIAIILVLILSTGSSIFIRYESHQQIDLLNLQLKEVKEDYKSQLNAMENLLTTIQTNLNSRIDLVLESIKKVEQQQQASSSKFLELEETVKGISLSSGDFSPIVETAIKAVVSIVTDTGQGSGAFVTKDGYIITSYHVIKNAQAVNVLDYHKKIYQAVVIGFDPVSDIAALKINGTFDKLAFADSDKTKVGEKVIAVGNPAGLGFTVTEGIISQLNRNIIQGPPLLQTDVSINPGNSGGPLLNIEGKIVGINKLKIAGYEGLGFAVPSNAAKLVFEQIIGQDI